MNSDDESLRQMAKMVRRMAETGIGTDQCLEEDCLPVMVHFYQPIPNIRDLEHRKVWDRISRLGGLDMRPDRQMALLATCAERFAGECVWPEHETPNPHQYHWRNQSFGFECASLLHYMIRHFRPRRFLEIGSGFSSRIINDALRYNASDGNPCVYKIIDPYPAEETKKLPSLSSVLMQRVEESDLAVFQELEAGDILFVDSGHVVKTGGDVNFMILDVLPILQPGVVIHFHDIPMPFEYGKGYHTNPQFRMFWTESYLLQAFMAFNREFEVVVASMYLKAHHPETTQKIFPGLKPSPSSGSFWIQRVLAK